MCLLISILSSCFSVYLSLCLYSRISRVRKRKLLSRILFLLMSDTCDFKSCVALHVRIANLLVMGSCCRGGIVNTGVVFSSVSPPNSSKALWIFAQVLQTVQVAVPAATYTPRRQFIITLNKIFVCGDDHLSRQLAVYQSALWLLRVSI